MKTIKIHPNDNVAVILDEGGPIPRGHKVALVDIPEGAAIIKYGFPIGAAVEYIPKGAHVHTHNCRTNLRPDAQYTYKPHFPPEPEHTSCTFDGFVRPDGSAGTRNELWIIPTVGCVNKLAERLAREGNKLIGGTLEGVYAYTHPYGCSQLGEDQVHTQRTLAGLVRHSNAAGVLVLGLGCENNNIPVFQDVLGQWDTDRVRFLNAQDEPDEIAAGMALLTELAEYAKQQKREPVDMSRLIIGLKCGGSDGLSGITANPLVGRVSDRVIACGGATVLTEVPEMFGAEALIMNRCVSKDVFTQTAALVDGWKDYYTRHGQVVHENPSPGNKAGGITTLEDKSLGCVQKGGTCPVSAVLQTGDRAAPGLSLLSGPGNDMVAVTGLTAAGAQIILFTTGRGTPLGAPVPTLKISSDTALYESKPNWIDFDAGRLITGSGMDELTDELWKLTMGTASGERTRNEENEYRQIAIFKDGVTL